MCFPTVLVSVGFPLDGFHLSKLVVAATNLVDVLLCGFVSINITWDAIFLVSLLGIHFLPLIVFVFGRALVVECITDNLLRHGPSWYQRLLVPIYCHFTMLFC